jgi:hypothetical protein
MPKYKFIFTYSVSPRGVDDEDKYRKTKQANKVRDEIAEIRKNGWAKLKKVETTFAGDMWLSGQDVSEKRIEAKKIVEKEIRNVIDEFNAYDDTWVYIALMIDGLGEHIEIII